MGFFDRYFKKKIRAEAQEIAEQLAGNAIQKIKNQLGYSSGSMSGGAKFSNGLAYSGSVRTIDHALLRQNARNAYHDTPQAKAITDRFADTIADIGLMLESTPKADILGISQEAAERWGADLDQRFDSWARSKKQHRAGLMTWYQSHRLYQIFQGRDNDIFTRLYYCSDKDLLNPLQFSFIDPAQIRGDAFTSTGGTVQQDDGIVRDDRGRENSYKIWIYQNKKYEMVEIPSRGVRSGRIFMLHGFDAEYAGQGRGYSKLGHVLQEFQNLTDFTLAQIKKAINQSNISLMVKPSKEEDASNPFEGILTNAGTGPAARLFGSNPVPSSESENVTTESLLPVNFFSLPEATMETPGSTGVFNLNKGEELKPFESSAPSTNYDTFVDCFTSYLAASRGMPIEVLLMRFNQNYSASRAALILFWRVVEIGREEMAADYLNPIVEMFVSEEIAAGRMSAQGWSDPRLRAAWLNCRWIGSPMPNIDPAKTAKADQLYIEMGAHDLNRVSRNLNGTSGDANRAKLKRQLADLPIPPWAAQIKTANIPDAEAEARLKKKKRINYAI